MPKKYYNPQDDVIQIKDGLRIPVESYDIYAEMHKIERNMERNQSLSGKTSVESSRPTATAADSSDTTQSFSTEKEPSRYFTFDGENLTFVDNSDGVCKVTPMGAVSGRPNADGSFSYSKENQSKTNKGPIPEGKHLIDLSSIRKTEDRTLIDRLGAISPIKIGKFPGGTNAWGEGRVDVQLDPKAPARTGITIHGGKTPGSAGCIDVVDNSKELFGILENLARQQHEKVPLIVDYSHTPAKVWWKGPKNRH